MKQINKETQRERNKKRENFLQATFKVKWKIRVFSFDNQNLYNDNRAYNTFSFAMLLNSLI